MISLRAGILNQRSLLPAILIAIAVSPDLSGFTKAGTIYTTDGTLSDVQAAIGAATPGDTISIPAGSYTWGTGQTALSVNKAIILAGAGPSNTTITLATDSAQGTSGVIRIFAAAVVRDFAVNMATGNSITLFSTGSTSGWRITNVKTNPTPAGGYFIRINRSYGLIDNCNITGAAGNNELIFGLGPPDSWQTANSLGGAGNVFIEDCTFNGPGYVCDANENSRYVVRFCTINGPMKVDGHGLASNPPRGVRQMEVYNNYWTFTGGSWPAIEIRGGTGMIFDNRAKASAVIEAVFFLCDYGYLGAFGGFGGVLQTPNDYPIKDQIGVGMDPKTAASEPVYVWNNRKNVLLTSAAWPRSAKIISAAAISLYRQQTGDSAATFTERDLIRSNRDFFADSGFDTNIGVSRGTRAQMEALVPTIVGYGFWVTDEGEWNALQSGPDGQLYVWNGSAWVLKYTPFPYPHPLRRPAPPSHLRFVP